MRLLDIYVHFFFFLCMFTSIFSSSFFWSISVIRHWSIEGETRTLSEATSIFLRQDWQEEVDKVITCKVLNSKNFSPVLWDESLSDKLCFMRGGVKDDFFSRYAICHHSPSRSLCCYSLCLTLPLKRWDSDLQPTWWCTAVACPEATGSRSAPCYAEAFLNNETAGVREWASFTARDFGEYCGNLILIPKSKARRGSGDSSQLNTTVKAL